MVFVTGTRRNPISIRWSEGWKSVFCSFWWIRTNSAFDGFCKKNFNLISLSLWNVWPTKNISSIGLIESSPVISSMSCIRCFPIWIVYDAASVLSPTAPFQNPAWNRLNTFKSEIHGPFRLDMIRVNLPGICSRLTTWCSPRVNSYFLGLLFLRFRRLTANEINSDTKRPIACPTHIAEMK